MIKFIPPHLIKWTAAIGSLITLLFSSWIIGRVEGANKEKLKQKDQEFSDFVETTERMNDADNVDRSDADILNRLRRLGGQ